MTRLKIVAGASLLAVSFAAGLAADADPSADAPAGLPKDLDGYEHINSIVVPDPASPVTGFHHFYMNDAGLKTFRSEKTGVEYPAGTVIVGKVYQPVKTDDGAYKEGRLTAYTVMRKRPDDPVAEKTGGWRFLKFDAHGEPVQIDPVADCFRCHEPHRSTDFVISEPLQ